jgi:hypothetical protein
MSNLSVKDAGYKYEKKYQGGYVLRRRADNSVHKFKVDLSGSEFGIKYRSVFLLRERELNALDRLAAGL